MQTARIPKPWLCSRGQTFAKSLVVSNSDETPFDFTGYELGFEVRTNPRAETVLLTATVLGNDEGEVTITIAAEDTEEVEAGTYWADFRMESVGGVVNYPFSVEFKVTETVTR